MKAVRFFCAALAAGVVAACAAGSDDNGGDDDGGGGSGGEHMKMDAGTHTDGDVQYDTRQPDDANQPGDASDDGSDGETDGATDSGNDDDSGGSKKKDSGGGGKTTDCPTSGSKGAYYATEAVIALEKGDFCSDGCSKSQCCFKEALSKDDVCVDLEP